jgi:glycosyltransferase involved in cell wall biosynthesis
MKPTTCLAMIVRDEAEVIERCIESVRPFIDAAVVVDTGSTDGTVHIVEDTFWRFPAEIFPTKFVQRPWVNFGHNRTELLKLAKGKADYLLLLDADMTVEQTGPWPADLPDECMVRIPSQEFDYRLPLLVRSDLDWRYEGVTHEYLTTDDEHTRANVDHLIVHHHLDGGTRAEKFERDLKLLADSDLGDPRNVFYLAQTHRDLGSSAEAIHWYCRRAGMGGFEEEAFYAEFQWGVGLAEVGEWDRALDILMLAWQRRPQRLEPLYEIVSRLRILGRYRAAHAFAVQGLGKEPPDDILFVSPWVYRYGLLFEFSIVAYWVGDHRASLEACDRLLEMDDLPEPYREQTERNRDFALGAVGAAA